MINLRLDGPPSRTYNPDANNIEGEVGFKTFWQKVGIGPRPGRRPKGWGPKTPPPGWGPKTPQGGKPAPGGRPAGWQQPDGRGYVYPDGSAQPIGPTEATPKRTLEELHAEIRGCMADFNHSPRCRMLLSENAMCATPQGMKHHDCIEAGLPITSGNLPGTTATVETAPAIDERTWFQKYGKLSMGAIGAGILAVGIALVTRES